MEKGSEEKQAKKTRFEDTKNKSSQRKASRNFSPNQDSKTGNMHQDKETKKLKTNTAQNEHQ